MKTKEEFMQAVKSYQSESLKMVAILFLLIGGQQFSPYILHGLLHGNPITGTCIVVAWAAFTAGIFIWCWFRRAPKMMRECGVICPACGHPPLWLKAVLTKNRCPKCGQPLFQ